MTLQAAFTELIRSTSTDLPADIERALRAGRAAEVPDSRAAFVLDTIIENVGIARRRVVPMCQDTGTLTFWIDAPARAVRQQVVEALRAAVAEATARGWLRQNTIEVPGGRSITDNLSASHPVVHWHVAERADLRVRLLMKGGGCENVGIQYALPDQELGAGRDLEGVRRCLLDAVWRAQGNGCAPGILGVCIGGDRAGGFEAAKRQLLRPLDDRNPDETLDRLERRVLEEAQTLDIGPMGMSGRTTLLGVKIGALSRLPASYFVSVSYLCWAVRRGELRIPMPEVDACAPRPNPVEPRTDEHQTT